MGQKSKPASIDIELEETTLNDSAELGDFLIQREKSRQNGFSSFFSNVGERAKSFVPKRMGGTGSIQDDIALRFGLSLNNNGGADSSSGSGWTPVLSRKERIIGFFVLLGLGITFFTLSSFYIPVLLFKARKFSVLFTLGSVFTFASLSVLWGFVAFMKHLFSTERILFTGMYFGSLIATLVFAISLQSTILTIFGIIFQVISLLSFIISYLPGGITGMKYLTGFISSSITRSLPV
jgi:hypothetical protein